MPIRIKSADLEAVFGRAKPLKEERVEVDRRQQRGQTASKSSGPEKGETVHSAADLFAARLQAAVAQVLLEERRRAERLRRAHARKAALRRGDLDAQVAAIADDLAVAVAAGVVRHLRSRHGLRTVVLILGGLAAGSGIAPVVLAAAAAALLRRSVLKAERAGFRADVDASKAARTGWAFANVNPADRARYAALVRSNLVDPAGPDAGPLIVAVGREQAARFVAWWAYASVKQRSVVERWDKPRPKQRPRAAARPARGRGGWEVGR